MSGLPSDQSGALKEIHEVLAILLIGLIFAHIFGVVFESHRSRENLIRAMISGYKQGKADTQSEITAHPYLALIWAIPIIGLIGFGALSGREVPASKQAVSIVGTEYEANCSDCHDAPHPSLMKIQSWVMLMQNLDDHFGEDASLDEDEQLKITAWLEDAAKYPTPNAGVKFIASGIENDSFSITGSKRWKGIHQHIPVRIFTAAPIFTKANCAACHRDAASGNFNPFKIKIPKQEITQ